MAVSIIDNKENWDRFMSENAKLKNTVIKVGFPAEGTVSKGKDGEQHATTVSEIAMIAGVHEYGSIKKNIPMRAFLRPAIDKNREAIKKLTDDLVMRVLDGTINSKKAFSFLGLYLVRAVKKEITDLREPKLSPKTIAAKGSDKPLIDTAQMINSVNFVEVSR